LSAHSAAVSSSLYTLRLTVDRHTHAVTGHWSRLTAAADSSHQVLHTHTHAHLFNGPFSRTTRVSQYQKGKTNLDFTGARDSEWHWHQLGHMQVCISLQTDSHASTPPLSFLQAGCPSCRPTNSAKALKALYILYYTILCLQCFDAVGRAAGRASGLLNECWGAGVIICLE